MDFVDRFCLELVFRQVGVPEAVSRVLVAETKCVSSREASPQYQKSCEPMRSTQSLCCGHYFFRSFLQQIRTTRDSIVVPFGTVCVFVLTQLLMSTMLTIFYDMRPTILMVN
eukprot:GHVQ01000173.1.p1 GENE.GHVQ01000173.1~~GHVQ01000173.1.p1  ORF type:complete len:112 (+),score=6.22 GHVQ01000173.1:157-492(+)